MTASHEGVRSLLKAEGLVVDTADAMFDPDASYFEAVASEKRCAAPMFDPADAELESDGTGNECTALVLDPDDR